MNIVKSAAGACVLWLAAAGAAGVLSEPAPTPANPLAQTAYTHAPAIDMRQFQQAFH